MPYITLWREEDNYLLSVVRVYWRAEHIFFDLFTPMTPLVISRLQCISLKNLCFAFEKTNYVFKRLPSYKSKMYMNNRRFTLFHFRHFDTKTVALKLQHFSSKF